MGHGDSGGGAIRELLAVFGFGVDTSELKKGEAGLTQFVEKVSHLAHGLAGLFAVHEIFHYAHAQAELLDQIEDTANALGISTERVQQFQFAAKALGDEGGTILNLMGRMQVTQQEAAKGNKKAAESFTSMGVALKDEHGNFKQADELFLDIADKIADTKDASKAAALATTVFGRAGRQILPFLKEGRDGFEELVEEYKLLGGGYSEKAIKAGADYEKQTAKLGLAVTSLKDRVNVGLFPILTKLVGYMIKGVVWFREMTENSRLLGAGLVALGGVASVFALKLAVAFSPIIIAAAAIAGLVLLIDDFMVFMEGGDSLIGETIDKMFGKGQALETIHDLRDTWKGIKDYFSTLNKDVRDFVDLIGDAWNSYRGLTLLMEGTKNHDAKMIAEGSILLAQAQMRNAPGFAGDNKKFTGFNTKAPISLMRDPSPPVTPLFERDAPWLPGGGRGPLAGNGDTHVSVGVTVPPGTTNAKEIGSETAKAVADVMKAERRAAAATFQRAGQK